MQRSDKTDYEDNLGKHGLEVRNENKLFTSFFWAGNQYVVGGSAFPNKRLYKAMWVSPGHNTENQIYFMCIKKCKDLWWQSG